MPEYSVSISFRRKSLKLVFSYSLSGHVSLSAEVNIEKVFFLTVLRKNHTATSTNFLCEKYGEPGLSLRGLVNVMVTRLNRDLGSKFRPYPHNDLRLRERHLDMSFDC